MRSSYDVIVIGSGNGGLAAAVKVLQAGKTCLVCERHNIPGGFATSFVRGRFEFEASLHELNGVGDKSNFGSTYALFSELGILDKVEFKQIKDAYRLISLKEGIDFTMPIGIENGIKAFDKLLPGGGKIYKNFIDLATNCADAMTYISSTHGHPDQKVMQEKYGDYLSVGSYSVLEVYDALKMPQIMRDILGAYWSYLGTDFKELNFAHYANMVVKYFTMGAVFPTMKSHGMSLAFETRIHELGGDIYFNTEVSKILTDEHGAVRGVRLFDGTEIAAKHVIANCSPHNVYSRMLDKKVIPERALKLANYRKFGGRGFTIFLGLNKSPKELGLNDHAYFIYETSNTVETYNEMKKALHTAGQASVCLNNVDPDCSPKGTSILYITTLITDDSWSNVKEKDYAKFKNKMADGLIKQFEDATGVNLHDHIEEIAVASPETYARYCMQPQGVIYGYLSQYNDSLMARAQMVEEDHFIPGLRIAGGYGDRLLGFSSSYKSGYNEGSRTLKDIEKEGEKVACFVKAKNQGKI